MRVTIGIGMVLLVLTMVGWHSRSAAHAASTAAVQRPTRRRLLPCSGEVGQRSRPSLDRLCPRQSEPAALVVVFALKIVLPGSGLSIFVHVCRNPTSELTWRPAETT